jgi:hypothetical protein
MTRKRNAKKQTAAKKVAPRTSEKVIALIKELREQGLGLPSIARELEKRRIKTASGGTKWHAPVVRTIYLRAIGESSMNAPSVPSVARKGAVAGAAAEPGTESPVEPADAPPTE